MHNLVRSLSQARRFFVTVLGAFLLAGCAANPAPDKPAVASTAPPPVAKETAPLRPTIRIKTGVTASLTDSSGNVWQPDQGFADGETIERPDLKIENTKDQAIYRAERYSMTSFTQKLPNGKYIVKLHFAETFEGITGPGQRVFSFNVVGKEYKDFDVWVKSGGALRAYVETVNVDVTDGHLDIKFTPNVENPEINGIEIIPTS
jgi:endoglucanase